MTYKILVEIEEYDPATDQYDNLDTPYGALMTFETVAGARAFVDELYAAIDQGRILIPEEAPLPEEAALVPQEPPTPPPVNHFL